MKAVGIGVRAFASISLIVVAVFGLVGLLQVWISRDLAARLLGRSLLTVAAAIPVGLVVEWVMENLGRRPTLRS